MSVLKHLKGVHVKHSKNTAGKPIIPVPVPERVYIPMSMHIGAPCTPVVKVGDHVKVGQLIGSSDVWHSALVHSSVSGDVEAITQQMTQMGRVDTNIVIRTDGRQEIADTVVPPEIHDRQSFLDAVRASGMVGLGGAAFPTAVKYNTNPSKKVEFFIVNAAECEPYITVDHSAMLQYTQDIVDGIRNITKWLGIPKAFIGIESNKPDAIAKFKEIVGNDPAIEIVTLRQIYPQGAERVIIYECTGRHLTAGKIPFDVGCIVSNVTTVLKLQQFIVSGMPLVTKFLTIDGNIVAKPQNVEVPIGTKITDIVDFCGGLTGEPKKIILGGPMMGRAIPTDDLAVLKGNNAVLFFDDFFAQQRKETACINCGRCVAGCPMNLMPAKLSRAFKNKDFDMLRKYNVMTCMDCGCCAYNCPARKPLNSEFRLAKAVIMAEDKKKKEKAEKLEVEAAATRAAAKAIAVKQHAQAQNMKSASESAEVFENEKAAAEKAETEKKGGEA